MSEVAPATLAPLIAEERRLRAIRDADDRDRAKAAEKARASDRAWRKIAAALEIARGYERPRPRISHRRAEPKTPGQRQPRQVLADHKGFVATLPCIATLIRTGRHDYAVQVAHQRFSLAAAGVTNPGLQRKSSDFRVLPLAVAEHARQHDGKELAYWAELGMSGEEVTALGKALHRATGDRDAAEDLLVNAALAAQAVRRQARASNGQPSRTARS